MTITMNRYLKYFVLLSVFFIAPMITCAETDKPLEHDNILIPMNEITPDPLGQSISNKMKLDRGVRGITYWIAPDCEYTVSIPAAIQEWMYPSNGLTNRVSITRGSNDASTFDFYQKNNDRSAYADATFFRYGGIQITRQQKDIYNWRYGKIHIYEDKLASMNSLIKKMVICHEIGHVMGLKDYWSNGSLMHSESVIDGRVNSITRDANTAINQKYP